MSITFEMIIHAAGAALTLFFLAQYFEYRTYGSLRCAGTALIWSLIFVSIAFNQQAYLSAAGLQALFSAVFCVWLLNGSVLRKLSVSVLTTGLKWLSGLSSSCWSVP